MSFPYTEDDLNNEIESLKERRKNGEDPCDLLMDDMYLFLKYLFHFFL